MESLFSNVFIEKLETMDQSHKVLTHKNTVVTVNQLLLHSKGLAMHLKSKGVNSRQKVVLLVEANDAFIVLFFALMMLDVEIVLIDPQMGKENFVQKYLQIQPDYVFIDNRLAFLRQHPVLRALLQLFGKDIPYWSNITKASVIRIGPRLPVIGMGSHLPIWSYPQTKEVSFIKVNQTLSFLITFTSGTLGSPKGVRHSYDSISHSLTHLGNLLKSHGAKRIATHLPQYILLGIISGIEVFVWKESKNPLYITDFISKHGITTLFGPPSDFLPILEKLDVSQQIPSLNQIYLGSAPVSAPFLALIYDRLPNVRATVIYGMTEHLMIASIDGKEKIQYPGHGDLVGYPFDKVSISITSDQELCLESNQLFSGYFNLEKAKKPHPSGDLAKLDRGRIVLLGRKKDMLIRRNFNIYPALYEPTIAQIANVRNVAMIGIYDDSKADEVVILCLELEPGYTYTDSAIQKLLKNGEFSIDWQALPDKIIFCPIPLIGRHRKVAKNLLKEIVKPMLESTILNTKSKPK